MCRTCAISRSHTELILSAFGRIQLYSVPAVGLVWDTRKETAEGSHARIAAGDCMQESQLKRASCGQLSDWLAD